MKQSPEQDIGCAFFTMYQDQPLQNKKPRYFRPGLGAKAKIPQWKIPVDDNSRLH